MAATRLSACATTAFAAMTAVSSAGPCTTSIDTVSGWIDAALEANAAAGPPAKQGTFAGMSEQPTPRSLAAVEVKLGEVSPAAVAAVEKAMAQARAADAAGDAKGCRKALASVRRILRHEKARD